jgi:hypothetical protein
MVLLRTRLVAIRLQTQHLTGMTKRIVSELISPPVSGSDSACAVHPAEQPRFGHPPMSVDRDRSDP